MKISFACPSCAAGGSVDASAAGRQARCKHCGHHFNIPTPGEPEADGYLLEEPAESTPGPAGMDPPRDSTFVRSRGGEGGTASRRPARNATEATPRRPRRKVSGFAWQTWLVRGSIATTITLAVIAAIAPSGVLIAGCTLLVLGMIMVLIGYGAGAYGAFHEDFLYGFLYLVIPFYAAYYIVTRWDDLWIWFTCSTVGVGLVLLGTEIVRWTGVAV
ncbi:MAG: hypothetical protein ACLQGP_22280 [Isosphaeraceae bacterium]